MQNELIIIRSNKKIAWALSSGATIYLPIKFEVKSKANEVNGR